MAAPTAILVAGMHRSGTSATAGALARMGISLGRQLLEPGGDNPKGYFENERAVDIHERLLAELRRSWDDVRALPPDWLRSEAAQRAAAGIDALIGDEFGGVDLWALKDPRLCRFLPLWIPALREHHTRPVVLFVVRSPDEVAASIAARNGWDPALSRLLWLRYLLEAEEASRGLPRAVVSYDSLLRDPEMVLGNALGQLGIAARPDRGMLREFVDRGERHHSGTKLRDTDDSGISVLCEQVHASFERIAAGGGDWDELRVHGEAFQAGWRQWGGNVDATAAMAAELRAQVEAGKVELGKLASELGAQVDWARDFVAGHETLEAERSRLQSELTAQVRWSEDVLVQHREAMGVAEAEAAKLRSDLTAQLQWSEQAVARHDALEAERARIQSELTAQVRWSEEFVASRQAEQAEQRDALRKLEETLAAAESRQRETDGIVASLREAHARALADLAAVSDRLQTSEDSLARVSAELASVLASASWRFTRPARAAADLGRRLTGRPASPRNST